MEKVSATGATLKRKKKRDVGKLTTLALLSTVTLGLVAALGLLLLAVATLSTVAGI